MDNYGPLPRYYVTSAPLGEIVTWRVVREETGPRGMRTLSFISGYPTRRAALSIANALGTYRNGGSDQETLHTMPTVAAINAPSASATKDKRPPD